MDYLNLKTILTVVILAIFISIGGMFYIKSDNDYSNDPDNIWISQTVIKGKSGYMIIKPIGMESRIVGGPFARGFMRWDPGEIERKLTVFPKDGIPEVTSPGFDKEKNEVIIFFDSDALKKYKNRPYYGIIVYGGKSIQLKEIEEENMRQIGKTGIFIARIPINYNIQHLKVHKVYVQAPPPDKTFEISWNNKVEVRFTPDCDC